jgi:hypothetical protein
MNQLQAKSLLESNGWSCKSCSCPGAKSYDCFNKNFRGMMIKLKPSVFRISRMGLTLTATVYSNFLEKLNEHEIIKQAS